MATAERVTRQIRGNLGYIGAGLGYLVAGIHIFHPERGFPRLIELLATGNASLLATDPRPVAFVLSGLAIVVGINLVLFDVARRRIYVLGMALMATYFIGYFLWHLTGHGGILPGREPLYHGVHPVEAVVSHLVDNPLVALSKIAEGALFAVLALLYRADS